MSPEVNTQPKEGLKKKISKPCSSPVACSSPTECSQECYNARLDVAIAVLFAEACNDFPEHLDPRAGPWLLR